MTGVVRLGVSLPPEHAEFLRAHEGLSASAILKEAIESIRERMEAMQAGREFVEWAIAEWGEPSEADREWARKVVANL